MEISANLGTLEQACDDHGLQAIPSGKNGRYLKKDYVKVLAMHSIKQRFGSYEAAPMPLKFRMSYEQPQLAFNYQKLTEAQQENIWESPTIWETEKMDGLRISIIYFNGFSAFGREINSETYLFEDKWARLGTCTYVSGAIDQPLAFDVIVKLTDPAVREALIEHGISLAEDKLTLETLMLLDDATFEEIMSHASANPFTFYLIDLYHFGNADLRQYPFAVREQYFDTAMATAQGLGLNVMRPPMCKDPEMKKAFHEDLMSKGREGTIAVNSEKPTELSGARRRDEWVKIKISLFKPEDENALHDTIDGFITNVTMSEQYPELVGVVEVSVIHSMTGQQQVIANVEEIPLTLRKSGMLIQGAIVEVEGDSIANERVIGARIKAFRSDKGADQCLYDF